MSKRSKMKIALVLLSCLVAVSYQQRLSFTPRIGYLPYWYGVLPNGQHVLLDSEVMPSFTSIICVKKRNSESDPAQSERYSFTFH
jgi:hypothetical protein